MSKKDERERMDDMLMETADLHCLRFVAPRECKPSHNRDSYASSGSPGVYVRQEGMGASPIAKPNNGERLLTRTEAVNLAAAIDDVTRPKPHGDGFFNRGAEIKYPETYAQFVEAWYEALGRRLGRAIDSAETRRSELRELRAALTGVAP